ncbi:MAG: sulfotransferase [Thermoanaerobaculia bacterium]
MTRPAVRGRIFIVGVPRSGTTLVQSLLAAHSATTSFTETHFFDRHFKILPLGSRPLLTANPVARVREFLIENREEPGAAARWFTEASPWSLRFPPLRLLQTRRVARRLLLVLDELAQRRGSPYWIEKTPRHLRYLPFLARLSDGAPEAKFVHVIRDGPDVVASLNEASRRWDRHYDVDTSIRRWNEDVAFSLSRSREPNDSFIFYEELVSRPEPTLRRILGELNLDWEPQILENYGREASELVTAEESWKTDVARPLSRSRTSDRRLTAEQRKRVESSLRRDLYEELYASATRQKSTDEDD